MTDVELKVGGKIYSGWTGLRVERSLVHAAGAFSLQLTERWPGQPQRWTIEPGAKCELVLDGETAVSGSVDRSERELDARAHHVRVTGRDAAGDLVDCSALLPGDRTDSLAHRTLLQAARIFAEPYGVTVTDTVGVDQRAPDWEYGPGDTIWDTLSRAARQFAVYLMSDGKGGLVITRAGTVLHPVALVQGQNVESARFVRDDSRRFATYILRGQMATDGSIDMLAAALRPEATAVDENARFPRTLMFTPEDITGGITLQQRADWERNHRRGLSRQVMVTISGWSAGGQLWRPNELVEVQLPALGLERARLLAVTVAHRLDGDGARTELTLAPRDAYDLIAESKKNAAGSATAGVPQATLDMLK